MGHRKYSKYCVIFFPFSLFYMHMEVNPGNFLHVKYYVYHFFSTWMKIQGRLRTGDHVVAIATTDLLYMGKTNYIMYQFPVHARHVNVDSRGVSKALWYILWNFYLVWIMTVIFILYLPDVWKSLAEESVQSFAHAHWIIFQFVGRITKLMTTNALRSASKPTTEFNYT